MLGDLGLLLTDRVTVLAAGDGVNRAGEHYPDWDNPIVVGEFAAGVQGRATWEYSQAREGAKATFRVYFAPEVPVDNKCRLGWGSVVLEVAGIPRLVVDHLRAVPHHLEVDAKEVVG